MVLESVQMYTFVSMKHFFFLQGMWRATTS